MESQLKCSPLKAFVVSLVGLGALSGAHAADVVVKIGHVAPLSGPQAHYGKDNENATRMAIDDLNAKPITVA